ncbi:hypothetical protein AAVH_32462, partial [Aphelenchoides avenae]
MPRAPRGHCGPSHHIQEPSGSRAPHRRDVRPFPPNCPLPQGERFGGRSEVDGPASLQILL